MMRFDRTGSVPASDAIGVFHIKFRMKWLGLWRRAVCGVGTTIAVWEWKDAEVYRYHHCRLLVRYFAL